MSEIQEALDRKNKNQQIQMDLSLALLDLKSQFEAYRVLKKKKKAAQRLKKEKEDDQEGYDADIKKYAAEMRLMAASMMGIIKEIKQLREQSYILNHQKIYTQYKKTPVFIVRFDERLDNLMKRMRNETEEDKEQVRQHKVEKQRLKAENEAGAKAKVLSDALLFERETQKLVDTVVLGCETNIKPDVFTHLLSDIVDDEKVNAIDLHRESKKPRRIRQLNEYMEGIWNDFMAFVGAGTVQVSPRDRVILNKVPVEGQPEEKKKSIVGIVVKITKAVVTSLVIKPILLPLASVVYDHLYQGTVKKLFKGPKHFVAGLIRIGLTAGVAAGIGYGLAVGMTALGVVGILTPPIVFGVPVVLAVAGLWVAGVVIANGLKASSKAIKQGTDKVIDADSESFVPSKKALGAFNTINQLNKDGLQSSLDVQYMPKSMLDFLRREKLYYTDLLVKEKKRKRGSLGTQLKAWFKSLSPFAVEEPKRKISEVEWVARTSLEKIENFRREIQEGLVVTDHLDPNARSLYINRVNGYMQEIELAHRQARAKVLTEYLHEKEQIYQESVKHLKIQSNAEPAKRPMVNITPQEAFLAERLARVEAKYKEKFAFLGILPSGRPEFDHTRLFLSQQDPLKPEKKPLAKSVLLSQPSLKEEESPEGPEKSSTFSSPKNTKPKS